MSRPPCNTGVLTFHRCINYGSYWQARCLVDGLRSRGHTAVLLEHHSRRVNLQEWTCGIRPVLPTPVPRRDYLFYGAKILRFQRALAALPRSRRFPLERPAEMDEFDLVVVGSDEVWNLRHPWYGQCPLFYGEGLRTARRIAHAASFGNYHASEGLPEPWAERLRSFDAISVRDSNSQRIVQDASGSTPELVLDPCLQFPPAMPEHSWTGPAQPFVVVYGHNFSARFGREVRRWAESRGLPLVSLGYRNAWADRQWLSAGPLDFAQAIGRAEAVATNFFHGCVFSLLNGKPFVCEGSPYRSTKVSDLMAALGGERHLVSGSTAPEQFDSLLGGALEPAVLRRIGELRQSSDAWLDRALS